MIHLFRSRFLYTHFRTHNCKCQHHLHMYHHSDTEHSHNRQCLIKTINTKDNNLYNTDAYNRWFTTFAVAACIPTFALTTVTLNTIYTCTIILTWSTLTPLVSEAEWSGAYVLVLTVTIDIIPTTELGHAATILYTHGIYTQNNISTEYRIYAQIIYTGSMYT